MIVIVIEEGGKITASTLPQTLTFLISKLCYVKCINVPKRFEFIEIKREIPKITCLHPPKFYKNMFLLHPLSFKKFS